MKSPLLLLALLPLACTSNGDPGPGGGKSDATCTGAAFDAKGICRSENGQFAPKICCEAAEPDVVCSFLFPSPLGQSSEDVAELIAAGRPVKNKDISKLAKADKDRFVSAATHLTFIEAGDGLAAAIDSIDEDSLELNQLELQDGEQLIAADWVRFFAGDTEVGVIFDADSHQIIAEIGDGDVQACVAREDITPCAGFAGLTCGDGLRCVDVPTDSCDPDEGGKDCGGMCVPGVVKKCGGLAGLMCADDEFCEFGGSCGIADQPGTCKPRPEACTEDLSPVCGCDGMTHGNACNANAAGTSVSAVGECVCGISTCDVGSSCCNPLTGACVEPGFVCAL